MYKKKYNPLPQFSDSDSEIDIFNSKGTPQKPEGRFSIPRTAGCADKKCRIIVLVLIVCAVLIATIFAFTWKTNYGVIITTKIGRIKGFPERLQAGTAYKFSGIPYAEPPVGELRWKPPLPKKKLSGIYTADKSNMRCIQYLGPQFPHMKPPSEDCLYLHIHTPSLNKNAKLPVFFWIHGGYSMNGFADMPGYYPDGDFALAMNVVGVSIEFRLNAFGFLTLKEFWLKDKSYGNYGLMDQILALEWVKENIANFGGDPDSVTIAGQSSGGTSIFALLASPLADGLFHRAIPMSGSPYFPRNYSTAAKENRIFINRSKCANASQSEIKDCMYNLTPNEILESIPGGVYPNWAMEDLLLFPTFGLFVGSVLVVDPIVLPVPPKDVSKLTRLKNNVSVLIGTTAQEPGLGSPMSFKSYKELEEYLNGKLTAFNTISAQDISDIYKNVNTYVESSTNATYLYETIVTDARDICPNNILAKDFRKSLRLSNTYRYVVAWRPDHPVNASGMITLHNAAHCVDSMALFGFKWWENRPITPSERQFMTNIREVFGKFIRTGKVDKTTPGQSFVFNGKGDVEILNEDYHNEQCKLWNNEKNGFLPYAWIN